MDHFEPGKAIRDHGPSPALDPVFMYKNGIEIWLGLGTSQKSRLH
jgi:hypothetical protein